MFTVTYLSTHRAHTALRTPHSSASGMGGNKAGPLPFSSTYILYICSHVEKRPRSAQELPNYLCAHTPCNPAMRTPQTNA